MVGINKINLTVVDSYSIIEKNITDKIAGNVTLGDGTINIILQHNTLTPWEEVAIILSSAIAILIIIYLSLKVYEKWLEVKEKKKRYSKFKK